MLRTGMMVVCAFAMLGCGPPEDAGDAGMDAPFTGDTGDAPRETVIVRGSCTYVDYGSTCDVACDVPPDVPITVTITWSGPYCCNHPPEIAPPQESFVDCRCEAGSVVCPRSAGATMRSLPASSCEFCPGTPSGSHRDPDASRLDAGPDALDAGHDASLEVDLDARPDVVALTNETTCTYIRYGSPCLVACELTPDVPIRLTVTWSGPYCCTLPPSAPTETFEDCRCLENEVRCTRFAGSEYAVPASNCEFCFGAP